MVSHHLTFAGMRTKCSAMCLPTFPQIHNHKLESTTTSPFIYFCSFINCNDIKEIKTESKNKMQAAKVKLKDMVSTAKEKVREHKAKSEEKAEMKTASTVREKEMARQKCQARIADAKAQLHYEKAEHRTTALAQASHWHGHKLAAGTRSTAPVFQTACPPGTAHPATGHYL